MSNYEVAYGEWDTTSETICVGHIAPLPKIKSHIKIGNMVLHNTHHFNWFHRKMWKLFFGFEIENVKED